MDPVSRAKEDFVRNAGTMRTGFCEIRECSRGDESKPSDANKALHLISAVAEQAESPLDWVQ